MATKTGTTETKRLSKSQRTHNRRLKQAARKEAGITISPPGMAQPGRAPKQPEKA